MIFGWSKKRRDRETGIAFVKAAPEILAAYGGLVAKHAAAYMDEKWLPVKKPVMKAALKVGWEMAKTDEQREWIKVGWTLLSSFQSEIGDNPVDGKIPPNASPDDVLAVLEPFIRVAKLAEAEAESDRLEFQEYIRQSSN
jgi:hypothetical protein